MRGAEQITLDLGVGPISVRFTPSQPGEHGVFGTMQQNDPTFGEIRNSKEDREALAAALNLSPDDLDPDLPAQVVSTGMPFCIVPLRSMEVAARLRISPQPARSYLDRIGAKFFYCITRAHANSEADWHARMQFDTGEDPATGSASGCAIAYLVRHGLAASGQPIVIEQGIEISRPSRIHVSASHRRQHRDKSVRRWPHNSCCKRTLFPAVMHAISTAVYRESPMNSRRCHTAVDAQALILMHLRSNFAVANPANHSYCWKALTTTLHATCRVVRDEIAFACFSDNLS